MQGWLERISKRRQHGECLRWRGSRWLRRRPPASEWVRESSNKREVGGRRGCKCHKMGWLCRGSNSRKAGGGETGGTGEAMQKPRRVEAATTAGRLVAIVARQGGWGQVDGGSNSNEANGGVAGVAGAGIEGASAVRQQEEYLRWRTAGGLGGPPSLDPERMRGATRKVR